MSIHPSPPNAAMHGSSQLPASTSRCQRIIEGLAFVTIWVILGYLLPVSENGYLLLGIPLTIGFQKLVRRRPLRELWAGNTTRFALDKPGVGMAAVLAAVPAYYATRALAASDWTLLGWYVAAIAGAAFAAFALRASSPLAMLRSAALPMAVGAGGMVVVLGAVHIATGAPLSALATVAAIAKYVALYFPATFVLEEVAFRGALDAHVHHEGETRGWQSALFVSALWGLWHLPFATGLPLPILVLWLVVVHALIGVPLSFAWRRTRNLAGTGLAHAVIDAVRNALLLGL